jgi:hypothetical protein
MSSGNQGPCGDDGDMLGWDKAQGELKLWHPQSLARGSPLHITIHWKNRWASTHTVLLPAHRPTGPPPRRPTRPPPY